MWKNQDAKLQARYHLPSEDRRKDRIDDATLVSHNPVHKSGNFVNDLNFWYFPVALQDVTASALAIPQ